MPWPYGMGWLILPGNLCLHLKITQDYFSLDWQRWMWIYLNFIHNIRVIENCCLMLEDVQNLYTISEIIKFRQKKYHIRVDSALQRASWSYHPHTVCRESSEFEEVEERGEGLSLVREQVSSTWEEWATVRRTNSEIVLDMGSKKDHSQDVLVL